MNILVIFLLLIRFSATYECRGDNLRFIPTGCDHIIEYPLIIEQEDIGPREREIGANIKRIECGIEIRFTDLETFDLLQNVEHIENGICLRLSSKRPAIKFKGNRRLKHIVFPNLTTLKVVHYQYALIFSDLDHYPGFVRNNMDELRNLRKLEAVFRKKGLTKCDGFFLHIEPYLVKWPVWVLITIAIVLFIFAHVVNVLAVLKRRRDRRNPELQEDFPIIKTIRRILPKPIRKKN